MSYVVAGVTSVQGNIWCRIDKVTTRDEQADEQCLWQFGS